MCVQLNKQHFIYGIIFTSIVDLPVSVQGFYRYPHKIFSYGRHFRFF